MSEHDHLAELNLAPMEYRVVCAAYGQLDHRMHHWPKRDLAKAEQAVIDADHHNEQLAERPTMSPTAKRWYAGESPYRVQFRSVSAWADVD